MTRQDDLSSLLNRAAAYETWQAPLDASLRRGVYLSIATTLLGLVTILALPSLYVASLQSTMVMHEVVLKLLQVVATASPVLGALNLCSLMLHGVLLIVTSGWLEGRPFHHWLAGGMTVVGALNAFVVALGLSAFLLSLVLSVIIGVLVIIVFMIAVGTG